MRNSVSVHAYFPVVFLSYGSAISALLPSNTQVGCRVACAYELFLSLFIMTFTERVSFAYASSLCVHLASLASLFNLRGFSLFFLYSVRLSNLMCSIMCALFCWLSSFASMFLTAQLFLVSFLCSVSMYVFLSDSRVFPQFCCHSWSASPGKPNSLHACVDALSILSAISTRISMHTQAAISGHLGAMHYSRFYCVMQGDVPNTNTEAPLVVCSSLLVNVLLTI